MDMLIAPMVKSGSEPLGSMGQEWSTCMGHGPTVPFLGGCNANSECRYVYVDGAVKSQDAWPKLNPLLGFGMVRRCFHFCGFWPEGHATGLLVQDASAALRLLLTAIRTSDQSSHWSNPRGQCHVAWQIFCQDQETFLGRGQNPVICKMHWERRVKLCGLRTNFGLTDFDSFWQPYNQFLEVLDLPHWPRAKPVGTFTWRLPSCLPGLTHSAAWRLESTWASVGPRRSQSWFASYLHLICILVPFWSFLLRCPRRYNAIFGLQVPADLIAQEWA